MDYIFGHEYLDGVEEETVKVTGEEHTDFDGSISVKREYDDSIITDAFRIKRKYRSADGEDGKCFDWYTIDQHYRYEDKFTPGIKGTELSITDLEIENMELAQQLTEAEIAIMELRELLENKEV